MGTPMAGHLIKGGHRVFLHTPQRRSAARSWTRAASRARAARKSRRRRDIIITMVPDTPHVRGRAVRRRRRRRRARRKGKIVVDMSSISPIATKEFAKHINALGCEYLDAPVSGGEVGAKAASLTIMVGGSEAAFAKVKPLFELMGKNITLVGRQRRRPDDQGREPDHRRAEHRGGRRSAAVRVEGRRRSRRRCARR